MPNMAALGAMGGFGRGLSNLAPMYMRLQERKQDLALRQQELEREQQERDMQNRMNLLRIAVTSGNQEFVEKAVDSVAAHLQTDDIDLSQIDWRDRKAEAGKAYLKLWEKYENKDIDLAELRTGIMEVNNTFPRTESAFKQQIGLWKQEQQGIQKEEQSLRTIEQREKEGLRRQEIAAQRLATEQATTKQVWDKTTGQYVQRTQTQINEDLKKDPYKYGKTKEEMLELRKAGATTIDLIGRDIGRKTALTKWHVEKDPEFISKRVKEFKSSVDIDLMEEEDKEKYLQDYVINSLSGLYKDPHFRRNKVTGEIQLWDGNNRIRSWPRINF